MLDVIACGLRAFRAESNGEFIVLKFENDGVQGNGNFAQSSATDTTRTRNVNKSEIQSGH